MTEIGAHPLPNDTNMAPALSVPPGTPDVVNRNGESPAPEKTPPRTETNGAIPPSMSEPAPSGAVPEKEQEEPESKDEEPSRVEKAEEIVDQIAAKVASATSFLGRNILRGISRLREVTEDFWAEAQNVRQGKQD